MGRSVKDIVVEVGGEVGRCLGRIEGGSLEGAVQAIAGAERVFVAGAGRSGLAVRALAMRLMHLGKTAYVVGDTTTTAVEAGDLLVIGSGSGRTGSLVAAAEKARALGVPILLVTIDADSPIGRMAQQVLRIDAPSPKAQDGSATAGSIQPMGAMFEQTMFLLFDALIVALMQVEGKTSEMMFANHANLE